MTDLEKLQGTWQQIGYERDGVTAPADELGWQPRTTIVGAELTVTLADGRVYLGGHFKLDPARDPKVMDITDTFGPEAGHTLLAIYAVEGGRCTFCAAYPGNERPTAFHTVPGQVLRVMQRVSP